MRGNSLHGNRETLNVIRRRWGDGTVRRRAYAIPGHARFQGSRTIRIVPKKRANNDRTIGGVRGGKADRPRETSEQPLRRPDTEPGQRGLAC